MSNHRASLLDLSDHPGGTRLIALARPDKKNAFNIRMAVELRDALAAAEADDAVRAILLTGSDGVFSAGADMATFAGRDDGDPGDLPLLAGLHRPLLECRKPLVALVNGPAIGMGVTLLPYFDIVWAGASATFATPFVRLGIVVEFAASWTLPRLIGRQRAAELLLRGTPIDAATAADWGLVARVLPDDRLLAEGLTLAADIGLGGPRALRETKRLLRLGEAEPDREVQLVAELEVLATCYGSEEHMAQVQAFLERRRG